MLKTLLYFLITVASIWAIDSINITNIFKKNKYYQARVLYLFIALSISYLVTNFLYDFFLFSKFM